MSLIYISLLTDSHCSIDLLAFASYDSSKGVSYYLYCITVFLRHVKASLPLLSLPDRRRLSALAPLSLEIASELPRLLTCRQLYPDYFRWLVETPPIFWPLRHSTRSVPSNSSLEGKGFWYSDMPKIFDASVDAIGTRFRCRQ